MDNRIKVGIRVRPLSEMEQQSSSSPSPVICEQGNQRITVGLDNRNRSSFAFDWCYSPASPSGSIYEQMCLPLINKVFEGYHATFFAYGQTGSGKTFTMGNSPESSDGIIQFAVNDIFEKRKAFQQAGKQVTIEVSYMEIYMEECYDLLSTVGEKKKVDVRENSRGETYVDSLTQRLVHTPEDFASCISHACRVRSVSKTAMNSHSSRSHAICTITVRVVTEDDTVVAKLNLVDLAGSERAKKTMASGDTLQEGININKGLLALGNVVSALSTKSKQMDSNNNNKTQANGKPVAGGTHIHVPYRESKLTRLLKDSLGGNGMTALLACVSPAPTNQDETINTLRFASRASSIVNVAKVNHEEKTDAHVLNQEVNRLRAQLSALQEKYDDLHKAKAPTHAARSSSTTAADVTDLLSGSSRLTTSFKSLVMHCFMEDVGIDDEVLQKLKEDLTTSAGLFGCEFVEEEENKLSESILEDCEISGLMDLEGLDGFNCVPPIAKVLDRLTNLETHLKKSLNRAAAAVGVGAVPSSGNGRVRVSDGSIGSATSVASGVDAEGEEASSKELMLSAIMDDSDLGLGDDVSLDVSGDLSLSPIHKSATSTGAKALACNQPSTAMTLVDAECPSQDAAASDVSSDALEESFERQVVQLDQMQTKFVKLTHLGHHYEHMIRKLNEEIHSKELEEKVKLLRKKEMEMQKILTTKERLAQQLDQKQEQIQTYKKDKVKLMKKMQEKEVAHRQETKVFVKNDVQARQRAVRAEANAAKLTRDLSSRERFWQSKLDAKKIEMERLKTLLQKREEKRGLQQDRIGVKQKMRKLRQSSPVYKELEEECKILDAGIAAASQTIAQWQVKLSDLEANLAGISGGVNGGGGLLTGGVAVTAAAGAAAGSALTTTGAAAAKTMTFKDFLQALMSSAPAQEGKEEWKTCLQTVWEHYRQTLQSLHQKKNATAKRSFEEMDNSGSSGLTEDSDASDSDASDSDNDEDAIAPKTAKRARVEEASSSSSSVVTLLTPSMDYKKAFTSIDAWKQHFPLRTIKLREEAWTKLKNALVLFFAACTMVQSTVSGDVFVKVTGPPEAATAAASSLSLDHEQVAACLAGLKLKEKWSKYTVKDLKTLLSDRGLPVSGTKKDLVSRIVSYELRNVSNTKPLTDDASADSDSRREAMDVDDVDAEAAPEAAASTDRPEQTKQQPLRDRTNYLKSLNELTTSAAAFATSAAAGTVTLSNHGISKRTFRLNLDELTEELENRPAPASTSVAVQDL
eukprot:gene7937-5710_t